MATGRQRSKTQEVKGKQRAYRVRSYLRSTITVGMFVLLFIVTFSLVWGLYELVGNQVQQVTEISFIKKEQIRSRTIAELKRNDFQLIASDLWGSAKTLSDMASRPEILADTSASMKDLVENAYTFGTGPNKDETIWEAATWYIAPNNDTNISAMEQVQRGIDFCGQSLPFTSEPHLNSGYTNPQDEGSYIAFEDSAMLCTHPKDFNDYYVEPMKKEDYTCPAEDLPFKYSEWNDKWYSPACRNWFKTQRENPDHGIVTDLYLFASGSKLGLTQCMPIIKQPGEEAPEFHGALCVDVNPIDSMNNFFPLPLDSRSQSLLFKSDEIYDKATEQAYFLSNDMIMDSFRTLEGSSFEENLHATVENVVTLEKDGFAMRIDKLKIEADKAILFDDEYVTWGEMELIASRRDNSTDRFVAYADKFLDDTDPSEAADLQSLKDNMPPENEEGVPGTVHPIYLYVVEDIDVEFDRLSVSDPVGGYSSIEESREGKNGASQIQFKFAYFFDGSFALYAGHKSERTNIMAIILRVCVPMIILTAVYMIIGFFLIKDTSDKITRGIIQLYETLEETVNNKKQGKTTAVLSFKNYCEELNQLHLAFNDIARTTILASSVSGDEKEKSLLNYSEAYYIFKEYEDELHKGICLANIGAIMMQKEDFNMAYISFELSCQNSSAMIHDGRSEQDSRLQHETNIDISTKKFVWACRQFQKGLSNFEIIKANYKNRDLLSNDTDNSLDSRLPTGADNDFNDVDQLMRGQYSNRSGARSGRDKENDDIDFEKMVLERRTNERQGTRLNDKQLGIKISQIETDFTEAIGNLGQAGKAEASKSDVMLDFAILIGLYYCELNFMCRIIPEARKPGARENHQRPLNTAQENALKEDRWNDIGIDALFTVVIDKLDELKKLQENTQNLFSSTHRDKERKGLEVIPWQILKQYQSYLKGFYFHSAGNIPEAMKWYTHSLHATQDKHSVNFLRLQALENIEQIISEKKEEEKLYPKSNSGLSGRIKAQDEKMMVWKNKNVIYDILSHHYIHKKSVVFIVDTEYSSVIYRDLANKYVKNFFKNNLTDKDHFGYISLGKDAQLDQICLEAKEMNTHLKEKFFQKMSEREPELVFSSLDQVSGGAKQKRLEKALERALTWQSTVEDKTQVVNGNVYVGPHKWIVCLIGSDAYTVQDFILNHYDSFKKKESDNKLKNLSISMMGLSGEPLKVHVQDYKQLTHMTREGEYLNIVNKKTADEVARKFFSSMTTYPSNDRPVVREHFQNI